MLVVELVAYVVHAEQVVAVLIHMRATPLASDAERAIGTVDEPV
jgi:hypothetical protein